MTAANSYYTTEATQALEVRVNAFVREIISKHPISAMMIVEDNRNKVISNMVQTVISKTYITDNALRLACMEFLAGDRWLCGVTCAFGNEVMSLYAPNRHHNVIKLPAFKAAKALHGHEEQGFLLYEHGSVKHISREDAYALACDNGQLRRFSDPTKYNGDELFSEDLW